jgi:hypothetical protein
MNAKFRPITVVGQTESPFTLQQKIYEWDGDRLELEISYPPMKRADAAILVAAGLALRGRLGTFYIGPRGAERATRGTATGGSITVSGGGQTGKTLTLAGWTGTLKAGDFLQVNHTDFARLYINLTDANGPAALDVFPKLRTPSPANGAAATFSSPVGVFRLAEPIEWDIDRVQIYGISFKAIEAI